MAEPTGPELAEDFAAANAEVVAFARACSAEQWQTPVPGEEWTVGVVIHHIAEGHAQGVRWLRAMVQGDGVADTGDDIDTRNVEHADRAKDCTVKATLELLEENGAQVMALLANLTVDDLAATAPFGPAGGQPFPAGELAAVLAGHARGHLAHAQDAVLQAG